MDKFVIECGLCGVRFLRNQLFDHHVQHHAIVPLDDIQFKSIKVDTDYERSDKIYDATALSKIDPSNIPQHLQNIDLSYVNCSICRNRMPANCLRSHLERRHPNEASLDMIDNQPMVMDGKEKALRERCLYCSVLLDKEDLYAHIKRKHKDVANVLAASNGQQAIDDRTETDNSKCSLRRSQEHVVGKSNWNGQAPHGNDINATYSKTVPEIPKSDETNSEIPKSAARLGQRRMSHSDENHCEVADTVAIPAKPKTIEPKKAARLEQRRSSSRSSDENHSELASTGDILANPKTAQRFGQFRSNGYGSHGNCQNVDQNAEFLRKRWLEKEHLSSAMEEQARKRRQYDDTINVTSTSNSCFGAVDVQRANAMQADANNDQAMIKCDYCVYVMPANSVRRHIHRKHPNVNIDSGLPDNANGILNEADSESNDGKCKYCGHEMPHSALSRHIQRKHPNQTELTVNKNGAEKPGKPIIISGQHVVYYSSSLIQRKLKENLIYEIDGRFYANEAK